MKVIITGDFCPSNRVVGAFEKGDYDSVLSEVRSFTKQADYSIVNFECPVMTGQANPIEKNGPNLFCSVNGVEAIKYAGFDCVTLANNHFLDFGEKGVVETINSLNNYGIDHVGGGLNLKDSSSVLYKDIEDRRLAIINCCEHEFSVATNTSAGCNPLNPIQQFYAIKEAKKCADIVLVITHGGHEHFQLPSPRMVETYRFFIDAGADAVVNHHQHCFSGYEVYNEKPIFYGLGNFCFDDPSINNGLWTEGYAVSIDFSTAKTSFEIYPYHQCGIEPKVVFLSQLAFNDKLNKLNAIIANQDELQSIVNDYYASNEEQYSNIIEPIRNRYYLGAKRRGWLPSFISKERKLIITNYVVCEAHRDRFIYYLQH